MQPQGSLPHSREPATCPYPEPDQSSLCTPLIHFLKIHFNVTFPSMPGSSKRSLSLRLPHQNPISISHFPLRPTSLAQIVLLDMITPIILGEEYRSLSSSLCNFLHSPVTSSLLGPNTPLSILVSSIHNNFDLLVFQLY